MLMQKKMGLIVTSVTLILTIMIFAPQLIPVAMMNDGSTQSETIIETALAPPGMLAYWELNESEGSIIHDSISPYVDGNTVEGPSWITGIAGSGLELFSGQYIDFQRATTLYAINHLTIEAWINLPDTSGLHTILMNSYLSTYIMYHFAIKDGRLYFDRQDGPPGNFYNSSAIITAGEWHHIAVVMNAEPTEPNTISFYIDSNQQVITGYNDYYGGPTGQVIIGADMSSKTPSFLRGMIDEVAVYSTLISQSVIEEHYQKGLRGLGYLDDFPINEAPVAVDDSYIMDQDTVLSVDAPGVLENDMDNDDDPIETDFVSNPSNGVLELNPDGSFVYTPTSGFVGIDTFEYRAYDGIDYSTSATVTITVQAVNHPPVAEDDTYTTDEDVPLSIASPGVLANDHDPEPWDYITAELVSGPQNGTLTFFLEGDFEYAPDTDWSGVDTFTYRVFDGLEYGNVATVTISVNSVNDAPEATDDAYTGFEDTEMFEISLLANDSDVDGDSLVAILVSSPSTGTFDFYSDGSFRFSPLPDWFGVETFTYKVNDGQEDSNVATVTLTISAVNDAPIASDIAYYADESSTLYVLVPDDILTLGVTDIDTSFEMLTVELVDGPAFGTLILNADGTFEYSITGWSGTVTFTYRVFDGTDFSNTATVTLHDIGDDDTTGPEISIVYSGDGTDASPGSWTVSVVDPESGVDWISVEIDGISVGTSEGIYAVPNSLGEHTIAVSAGNADLDFGPEDQETNTLTDSVAIIDDDITGPEITIIYSGDSTDGSPGIWTVTVVDPESGIDSIIVEIDGVSVGTIEGIYEVPNSPGEHTIMATATNGDFDYGLADQETSILTNSVTIIDDDTTGPAISVIYSGATTDGSPGIWTVSVIDLESGIDWINVEIDGIRVGTFAGTYAVPNSLGEHTITVSARNADLDVGPADQETSTLTDSVTIIDDDTTGPEITIIYSGDSTDGSPGIWTVSVVDPESGIDSINVEIDSVSVGTTAGIYAVPNSPGEHTITVTATNGDLDYGPADQETNTFSNSVTIIDDDTTGPEITIIYTGDSTDGNPGAWTIAVIDLESRIDWINVEIDGVSVGNMAGIYIVPNSLGEHTITVTATNADLDYGPADQETSTLTNSVTIIDDDTTGPEITIIYTGDSTDGSPGTWTVTITDAESGIEWINVEIDGIFVGTTEGPYAVPNLLGPHTIMVTAANADLDYGPADQETSTSSHTVTIVDDDVTLPKISIIYTGDRTNVNPGFWTITVWDPESGIYSVYVTIDGIVVGTLEGDYAVPNSVGFHSISVTAVNNDLDRPSDQEVAEVIFTVKIEVISQLTEIIYTGDTSGAYSDPVYLEALLLDATEQSPIPGMTIMFTLGTHTAYAVTNEDGVASVVIILDQKEGIYELIASFDDDGDFIGSSSTSEFTINRECALVIYSGVTLVEASEEILTLRATVFDDADGYWGDLTNAYVTFTFYLSSDPLTPVYVTYPVRVRTTDVVGVGLATLEISNLPKGDYLLIVRLLPEYNRYYCNPDSDKTSVSIYEPERAHAHGAGKIKSPDGHNSFFAFSVKYTCKGTLKGFILYTYTVGDSVYLVKSRDIVGFDMDGSHAFFEVNCTISGFNFKTWEMFGSDEKYLARIDVFDNKRKPERDVFQIRIYDNLGLVEYEAGFDPYGYLANGCIVVTHGRKY